ncbi:hypothetical protein [Fervidibacillus halotolerans]|uniref:Transmembrane protein n=1 Tax=Fervidibacillus halotolerans TaxID=2980027 RepID=A0A9E8S0R2_9BACI|nr:hypothetical protein [Fervidibacillus halotolerans]WAA12812.1 hypothetical protein OE105_01315 [Fervidibacillus halotolerans]
MEKKSNNGERLRQSMTISNGSLMIFFENKIAFVLILLSFLSLPNHSKRPQ